MYWGDNHNHDHNIIILHDMLVPLFSYNAATYNAAPPIIILYYTATRHLNNNISIMFCKEAKYRFQTAIYTTGILKSLGHCSCV